MSFENPTPLRIGMHGTFAGKDFRLVGRMVMGVEINGETYYWNEFNLQAKTGEAATLVCEDGEWRLFTEFEPDYPLTAADAAQKQVGDRLNLTGVDVRVTLVSTSRVYRIEGKAPAGERVGDVDNYFNAEAGDVMQVVNWSGQKVEYYNGISLTRGAVEKAFRLSRFTPPRVSSGSGRSSSGGGEASGIWVWLVVGGLFLGLWLFENVTFSSTYEAPPIKHVSAPLPPLTVGSSANWDGKKFRITTHLAMEVAEVGSVYERNEYELTDEYGITYLMVCGEKPGLKDWTLYTPLAPLVPPTPQQSAAKKSGDTVNIDGVTATISELAQFTVKSVDATTTSRWHQGDVCFGYNAKSEYNSLLARWDNRGSNFWRGKNVSAKEFIARVSATNRQ